MLSFYHSVSRVSEQALMGLVGGQRSLYVQQMNMIMRTLRQQLTVEALRREVEASDLTEQLKRFAKIRIDLAAQYIDDNQTISTLLKPGRLIIVDLRDGFTQEDEALGLFVVLLQLFSEATYEGRHVNKLVVFDEAHKYIQNEDLVVELKSIVSEMRHKATSILIASQDPRSVHQSLIELSTQIILHRFNSPDWLKHIQRVSTALGTLTSEKMNNLQSGEVYAWSREASERAFSLEAVKVRCRPRVTQHGGATKTAVSSADKEAQ
jgi:DNA helicase HerA-like ATPase